METSFCDEDYAKYLRLASQWCGRFQAAIWAYCLVPNHVHLVVVQETSEGLARALGEAHRRYTRYVNFREGWRGHLWQERFASFVWMNATFWLRSVMGGSSGDTILNSFV